MSYDLKMLSDRAACYWSLSGNTTDFINGNNLIVNNLQYSYPPLISNSASSAASLKVLKNTSASWQSVYENNHSKFIVNDYNLDFTISLWFNFNNQFNGSGNNSVNFTNNNFTIFKITDNAGNVLGKIYYDYLKNTIRFSLSYSTNNDSYYVLRDFDQTLHIVAIYSKGNISLFVNGIKGLDGSANSNSDIFNTSASNIYFVISGENNASFLINGIAFFNYKLSMEQINRHITFASNTGKPLYQSSVSSNSFFNLFNKSDKNGFALNIYGKDFDRYGKKYGSIITTSKGLEHPVISSPYANGSILTNFSSSGMTYSGSGAIRFNYSDNLSTDFSTGLYINAQLNRTASATDYIYSLNFSGKYSNYYLYCLYYLYSGNFYYSISLYDSSTLTSTGIINQNVGSTLAPSANIGVAMNKNYISLYTSEGGSSSATYSTASTLFNILNDGNINFIDIGNFEKKYDSSLTNKIKNFGINNSSSINYTASYNFTNPSQIMFRLTSSANPYFVSQYGYWQHIVRSLSIDGLSTYGTHFDWRNMDNCIVSLSYDGGLTFTKINRNSPASSYDPYENNSYPFIIKVELSKEYEYDSDYQTFYNLSYIIHDKNTLYSTSENYQISQKQSASNNYTISLRNSSILNRINNFGLKFTTSNPSSASLSVPVSSSYNAIEFWYRPDNIKSGSNNFLIHNYTNSSIAPAIWINSSSKFQSIGGTLYINGASVSNNSVTASAGEIYHILLALTSNNTSNFIINGAPTYSVVGVSACATYGFLNIWKNSASSSDVLLRYQSFFTPSTYSVVDNNTKSLFSSSATQEVVKTIRIGK